MVKIIWHVATWSGPNSTPPAWSLVGDEGAGGEAGAAGVAVGRRRAPPLGSPLRPFAAAPGPDLSRDPTRCSTALRNLPALAPITSLAPTRPLAGRDGASARCADMCGTAKPGIGEWGIPSRAHCQVGRGDKGAAAGALAFQGRKEVELELL